MLWAQDVLPCVGPRWFFHCRGACRERVEAMTSGDGAPFLFIMNIQVGFILSCLVVVFPFLVIMVTLRANVATKIPVARCGLFVNAVTVSFLPLL